MIATPKTAEDVLQSSVLVDNVMAGYSKVTGVTMRNVLDSVHDPPCADILKLAAHASQRTWMASQTSKVYALDRDNVTNPHGDYAIVGNSVATYVRNHPPPPSGEDDDVADTPTKTRTALGFATHPELGAYAGFAEKGTSRPSDAIVSTLVSPLRTEYAVRMATNVPGVDLINAGLIIQPVFPLHHAFIDAAAGTPADRFGPLCLLARKPLLSASDKEVLVDHVNERGVSPMGVANGMRTLSGSLTIVQSEADDLLQSAMAACMLGHSEWMSLLLAHAPAVVQGVGVMAYTLLAALVFGVGQAEDVASIVDYLAQAIVESAGTPTKERKGSIVEPWRNAFGLAVVAVAGVGNVRVLVKMVGAYMSLGPTADESTSLFREATFVALQYGHVSCAQEIASIFATTLEGVSLVGAAMGISDAGVEHALAEQGGDVRAMVQLGVAAAAAGTLPCLALMRMHENVSSETLSVVAAACARLGYVDEADALLLRDPVAQTFRFGEPEDGSASGGGGGTSRGRGSKRKAEGDGYESPTDVADADEDFLGAPVKRKRPRRRAYGDDVEERINNLAIAMRAMLSSYELLVEIVKGMSPSIPPAHLQLALARAIQLGRTLVSYQGVASALVSSNGAHPNAVPDAISSVILGEGEPAEVIRALFQDAVEEIENAPAPHKNVVDEVLAYGPGVGAMADVPWRLGRIVLPFAQFMATHGSGPLTPAHVKMRALSYRTLATRMETHYAILRFFDELDIAPDAAMVDAACAAATGMYHVVGTPSLFEGEDLFSGESSRLQDTNSPWRRVVGGVLGACYAATRRASASASCGELGPCVPTEMDEWMKLAGQSTPLASGGAFNVTNQVLMALLPTDKPLAEHLVTSVHYPELAAGVRAAVARAKEVGGPTNMLCAVAEGTASSPVTQHDARELQEKMATAVHKLLREESAPEGAEPFRIVGGTHSEADARVACIRSAVIARVAYDTKGATTENVLVKWAAQALADSIGSGRHTGVAVGSLSVAPSTVPWRSAAVRLVGKIKGASDPRVPMAPLSALGDVAWSAHAPYEGPNMRNTFYRPETMHPPPATTVTLVVQILYGSDSLQSLVLTEGLSGIVLGSEVPTTVAFDSLMRIVHQCRASLERVLITWYAPDGEDLVAPLHPCDGFDFSKPQEQRHKRALYAALQAMFVCEPTTHITVATGPIEVSTNGIEANVVELLRTLGATRSTNPAAPLVVATDPRMVRTIDSAVPASALTREWMREPPCPMVNAVAAYAVLVDSMAHGMDGAPLAVALLGDIAGKEMTPTSEVSVRAGGVGKVIPPLYIRTVGTKGEYVPPVKARVDSWTPSADTTNLSGRMPCSLTVSGRENILAFLEKPHPHASATRAVQLIARKKDDTAAIRLDLGSEAVASILKEARARVNWSRGSQPPNLRFTFVCVGNFEVVGKLGGQYTGEDTVRVVKLTHAGGMAEIDAITGYTME